MKTHRNVDKKKSLKLHIYIQALNHSTAVFTIKTTYDGSFISLYIQFCGFYFEITPFQMEQYSKCVQRMLCRLSHSTLTPIYIECQRLFPFIYRNVCDCYCFFFSFLFFRCSTVTSVVSCITIYMKYVQRTSCTLYGVRVW